VGETTKEEEKKEAKEVKEAKFPHQQCHEGDQNLPESPVEPSIA
jgi:hypothetical protein